nr:thiamine-phosphate kinase [Sphingomonas sp.]
VSDGLLLDLQRLCAASGCGAEIELESLPLSSAFIAERGQDQAARLFAASGGDDYALLAAFGPGVDPAVTLSLPKKPTLACIGKLVAGSAVALTHGGEAIPLPERLGYEHRTQHPPLGNRR